MSASREEMLRTWQYAGYLRRLLQAGKFRREVEDRNGYINEKNAELDKELREKRYYLKSTPGMHPRAFMNREATKIKTQVANCVKNKKGYFASDNVNIGKRKAVEWSTLNKRIMSISVGYMWSKRVWEPLYRDRYHQTKSEGFIKQYFLLDAVEVKTAQRSIHVYRVRAYDFKEHKHFDGYVGQSRIGDRRFSVPKATPREAIAIGLQLASGDIDKAIDINQVE